MLMVGAGSLFILTFFVGNLKNLVDFVTTVSFLAAPVFAVLNHRAIMAEEVPEGARPGAGLWLWSIGGITALGSFAAAYIYLVFVA